MAAGLAAAVLSVAIGAYAVDAHGVNSETRAELEAALESQDFEAWSALHEDRQGADEWATEENFAILVEAHALREAGDEEGARALLEENDLRPPHKGMRGEMDDEAHEERRAQMERVKAAIEAGDYTAWLEVMGELPMADKLSEEGVLTEATFNVLTEAHALHEAGDNEAAHELLQSNEIRLPGMGLKMRGHIQR